MFRRHNKIMPEVPAPKKIPFTFSRTISLDGISIIVACITCSAYFGAMGVRVTHVEDSQRETKKELLEKQKDMADRQSRDEQIAQNQSETIRLLSANVQVLTTIVNERTTTPNHKP